MARLPRISVPGQALHIIQRGNNRQPVFFATDDYQRYLDDLEAAARRYGCAVHAYVLMTNHVHLLVTPTNAEGPSRMMQAVGRRYVRYVNQVYQRTGTLWEGRFKSGLIDSEHYLLTCSRYIELNPVRAGMVFSPDEYRWSSYAHNGLGRHDTRISVHRLYDALGTTPPARQAAYCALFKSAVCPADLQVLREGTEKGEVIGGARFRVEIEAMLARRVTRLPHGGDRRSEAFQAGNQPSE